MVTMRIPRKQIEARTLTELEGAPVNAEHTFIDLNRLILESTINQNHASKPCLPVPFEHDLPL